MSLKKKQRCPRAATVSAMTSLETLLVVSVMTETYVFFDIQLVEPSPGVLGGGKKSILVVGKKLAGISVGGC